MGRHKRACQPSRRPRTRRCAYLALARAALIITLMLTGFEVHGSYVLFGFGKAVGIHTIAAWSLVTLRVFAAIRRHHRPIISAPTSWP